MKIVNIDEINPSTYNPRVADPERLNLIELSLKKLGFLLPIFATEDGEIISGHQRHHVAKKMGMKKVPVEYIKNIDLKKRKNLNISFNLGTNDAPKLMYGKKLKEKIKEYNIFEKGKNIPNKNIHDFNEIMPCINPTKIDINLLINNNYKRFDEYYLLKTKQLIKYSAFMPIIIDEKLNVINGIGRLHYFSINKKKFPKVDCIILPNYLVEFADYMLNYVSMDFDIHNKYKDELRFNSFKRHTAKTEKLGQSYYIKISKHNPGRIFSDEFIQKFIREYGNRILDFGAGHLRNADILNNNHIPCVPFEPFVIDFNNHMQLDFNKSVKVCDNFLEEYSSNDYFSSIFLNAVFNSVPFKEDREKILCILSEIATIPTKIIIWTTSYNIYNRKIKNVLNNNTNSSLSRNLNLLNYEKRISIQDISDAPKVQKYMTPKELTLLCQPYFKEIKTRNMDTYIYCECSNPIKQDWSKIEEALDFEFNLKHPNGKTLGLNEKAKEIFKKVREQRERR